MASWASRFMRSTIEEDETAKTHWKSPGEDGATLRKDLRSGPYGVGDAFLLEATLRSAGELLLLCRNIASFSGVGLALLHEACQGRTGELLLGALRLACRGLRVAGRGKRQAEADGEGEESARHGEPPFGSHRW